jgi:hypothetical protein
MFSTSGWWAGVSPEIAASPGAENVAILDSSCDALDEPHPRPDTPLSMTDARRWYTEPETFVAVAALVVSLSALGVGVYEARLQRDHDRAEVWPHVEVEVFVAGNDGARVQAENTGLGPAVVESIDVTVDGRPQRDWPGALAAIVGDSVKAYDNNTVFQHSLRPGDRVNLLGIPIVSMPSPFWKQIRRMVVTICYRSVFGQKWVVQDTLGAASHWADARDCPSQRAMSDF